MQQSPQLKNKYPNSNLNASQDFVKSTNSIKNDLDRMNSSFKLNFTPNTSKNAENIMSKRFSEFLQKDVKSLDLSYQSLKNYVDVKKRLNKNYKINEITKKLITNDERIKKYVEKNLIDENGPNQINDHKKFIKNQVKYENEIKHKKSLKEISINNKRQSLKKNHEFNQTSTEFFERDTKNDHNNYNYRRLKLKDIKMSRSLINSDKFTKKSNKMNSSLNSKFVVKNYNDKKEERILSSIKSKQKPMRMDSTFGNKSKFFIKSNDTLDFNERKFDINEIEVMEMFNTEIEHETQLSSNNLMSEPLLKLNTDPDENQNKLSNDPSRKNSISPRKSAKSQKSPAIKNRIQKRDSILLNTIKSSIEENMKRHPLLDNLERSSQIVNKHVHEMMDSEQYYSIYDAESNVYQQDLKSNPTDDQQTIRSDDLFQDKYLD